MFERADDEQYPPVVPEHGRCELANPAGGTPDVAHLRIGPLIVAIRRVESMRPTCGGREPTRPHERKIGQGPLASRRARRGSAALQPFGDGSCVAPGDVGRAERLRERHGLSGAQRMTLQAGSGNLRDLHNLAVGRDRGRGFDIEVGRDRLHGEAHPGEGLLVHPDRRGQRKDRRPATPNRSSPGTTPTLMTKHAPGPTPPNPAPTSSARWAA